MIDPTRGPRWARLLGSFAAALALVAGCSANDTTPLPTGGSGGGEPQAGVGGSVSAGTGSGGSAGTGGGAGGSGGSSGGAATLVEPIQRGTNYVLEFGDLYFEVSPTGARIIDVHLAGGTNLLTGPDINTVNYGSTFWTSPQSGWNPNWPPVPEIDSGAYTPAVASPSVSFVGSAATRIPARVSKRFTADLARVAVVADYTITGTGATQMFAPWEVTRVYKRGITFYPTGTGAPRAGGSFQLPPTTSAEGCTWHEAPAAPGVDQKLLADGSGGWLAHVDGNVVIVKQFPDVPAGMAAPGEDEIEIFVSGSANYIEIEQQGVYQPVAMNTDLTWTVTWFVRQLPPGVSASVGNPELVQFVQSLLQ